jgi:hypothetical protein
LGESFLKEATLPTYKIIFLFVALYGYANWSLTLRKDRRLRALENWVLRKTFGPKKNYVTGGLRKATR